MRLLQAGLSCIVLAAVLIAADNLNGRCELELKLVDAASGQPLPGLVQITAADGGRVPLPELLSRGLGLKTEPINRWSVLPGAVRLSLPQGKLTISALAGLETELATATVDLSGLTHKSLSLPLTRFYRAAEQGLRSGNTHLHLMNLTREAADRYLREIPRADSLDLLFVSYLERAGADRDYISNRYTLADLEALAATSGVAFGNGEEHRHNFLAQGQGYGHVMLLDLQELVQPVSIGPGIMKIGSDGLPLQRGIDAARRQKSTVIWCHNAYGLEDIPNWATARLAAQNIFDGGPHGSYQDTFYRYLNAGLRVPFSTGTDWFIYDFSRVYVRLPQSAHAAPPGAPRGAGWNAERGAEWLAGLTAGRSYITNGPLLEFQVAGRDLGDTLALAGPGTVEVTCRAQGRGDFERLELIQNGQVIASAASQPVAGHFAAELRQTLRIERSCWLALRTPPPPVQAAGEAPAPPKALNELGQPLFSHTSAIYVEVAGRRVFDADVVRGLIAEMESSLPEITRQGKFQDDQERLRVEDVYRDGIAALRRRLVENP